MLGGDEMTERTIPLAKLETVNDSLAEGIDTAGSRRELFLTKLAFYLAAHHASEDELKKAVEISLKDLGG
jgi:hypothetical protein